MIIASCTNREQTLLLLTQCTVYLYKKIYKSWRWDASFTEWTTSMTLQWILPIFADIPQRILSFQKSKKPCNQEQIYPLYSTFHIKRNEQSVENGCLLWGFRVIIPQTLRQQVLKKLHQYHPGMVKMKDLGWNYVWWPGMDVDFEEKVNCCYTFQSSRTSPARTPLHPWERPREPWHCIHMDCADYNGKNLPIVTNVHSKWKEVYLTGATNSTTTIEKLMCCFATHGLPNLFVSDNGTCFTSLEFAEFTRKDGIKHKLVSPYHQATNSQAESSIKIVKSGLRRMSGGTLETKLSRFLLSYRTTPYATTGVTSAELLMKRKLQTNLDKLKPSTSTTVLLSLSEILSWQNCQDANVSQRPGGFSPEF